MYHRLKRQLALLSSTSLRGKAWWRGPSRRCSWQPATSLCWGSPPACRPTAEAVTSTRSCPPTNKPLLSSRPRPRRLQPLPELPNGALCSTSWTKYAAQHAALLASPVTEVMACMKSVFIATCFGCPSAMTENRIWRQRCRAHIIVKCVELSFDEM